RTLACAQSYERGRACADGSISFEGQFSFGSGSRLHFFGRASECRLHPLNDSVASFEVGASDRIDDSASESVAGLFADALQIGCALRALDELRERLKLFLRVSQDGGAFGNA